MVAYRPDVLWSQRSDTLNLTFNVNDSKDIKVDVDEDKLSFACASGDKDYDVEMVFFDKIDPESIVKTRTDRCYNVQLKKKVKKDDYWPRLLSDKAKQHWLRLDFSTWKEEDVENDDELGNMMYPGQQDLNNIGRFGDMSNFDKFNTSNDSSDEVDDLDEAPLSTTDEDSKSGDANDITDKAVIGEPNSVTEVSS